MRILVVLGVRPQLVIASALLPYLSQHQVRIVHTGQHYDANMSGAFLAELGKPDDLVLLTMRADSRSERAAGTLIALRPEFIGFVPELVVVVGDADPALIGAFAANLHGVPLAHVEAGLRCRDPSLPEERNRRCIDSLAAHHFAPSPACLANLRAEGAQGALFTGDLLLDKVTQVLPSVRAARPAYHQYNLTERGFLLVTVHRGEATASRERLTRIVESVVAQQLPVLWPVHPGTRKALSEYDLVGRLEAAPTVQLIEPQPYRCLLSLVDGARLVMTDSGGLQREAFYVGRPCVVLRGTCEFPETIDAGGARLVDDDPAAIAAAMAEMASDEFSFTPTLELFGSGQAGSTMAKAIDAIAG